MKVLLCGGTGGLGKLLTLELGKRGYDVISTGSKQLDIRNEKEVRNYLSSCSPEVLVNLASVSIDSLITSTISGNVDYQIGTNIYGNLNLVKHFSRTCKEKNIAGRFIYFSSILSTNPVAGAGIYSSSKAFNDNIIKVAALENAKHNITFNSIQLGYMKWGLCDRLKEEIKDLVLKKIPLRRFGEIQEITNVVEMIINTNYMTGACIPLDGGLSV